MAQKALKTTAKRNADALNRTHLLALAINSIYVVLRLLVFRSSFSRSSLLSYVVLSSPALAIEYVFEHNSRPKYDSAGVNLVRSGDDLESKGIMEWMWDVLYWTWACIFMAAIAGDWAWWFYLAVPVYSAWLAYSTFGSVRNSLGGNLQSGSTDTATAQTGSKRQQKMEKRGAQQTQHR